MRASDLPEATQTRLFGRVMKPAKKRLNVKGLEDTFAFQCKTHELPEPTREYQFAKGFGRLWRFDFAWLDYHVAVEIEGLTAVQGRDGTILAGGRHASFAGFRGDCEKYARAAILGWLVLRFEKDLVTSGAAVSLTEELLKVRGWRRT